MRIATMILMSALCLLLIAGCGGPANAVNARPPVGDSAGLKPAPAASAAAGETRLISQSDEIVTRLDSGLTVVIKRYPVAPIVSVRMIVRAGSIWEGDYLGAGISHLFEHLLARAATARRSEQQNNAIIERIGASCNANTSFDRTVYQIDVPSQHLVTAIDLEADWVTRPIFPEDEVQRELGVVQRELEMYEQNPDRQFQYKLFATRYLVHPARFPVIGQKAALASLTRKDILAYHRKMYVPGNVVVSIAGDLDPEATLAIVKQQFADFTAKPTPAVNVPAEPPMIAPRTVIYPTDVAQVRFGLGFPTVSELSDEMYPLDVLDFVLAGGQSSRLVYELRDQRRLALGIGANSFTPSWADGMFLVSGMCLPQNWPTLRDAILAELSRYAATPIAEDALADAKRQIAAIHVRSQQTTAQVAETLGYNQLTVGDAHFSDRYIEKLNRVTAQQVQAAARKYFDPNKLFTVLVVPRNFNTTTRPDSTTQPSGAIVLSPIRKVVLDNGLTVLLRRNTAVPLVSVQMTFGGGLLAESPEQNGICQFMTRAALRGTKARTGREVFAMFERAGGTLASNSGRHSFSFSASVMADQLTSTLPVFAEVVTQPAFADPEVDRVKAWMLAEIARTAEDLDESASRFFFAKMFGDFPYAMPLNGTADTISRLTSQDAADFHRRLTVGGNAVLAIFGDIDVDATEKFARRVFADLPKGDGAMGRGREGAKPPVAPRRDEHFVEPTKLTEAAEVCIGFAGVGIADADRMPLIVLDAMISGYELPSGWLHEVLRGRQLVYVVHAINLSWRQAGVFMIYAQCQPDKTRQVIDAINQQLDRVRRGELAAERLADAKASILAVDLMRLQTNDQQSAQSALDELLGRGYDHYLKVTDEVNAVTLADVNRVARKYLTHSITTVTTCKPELVEKK